jgi:CHAD domain-containing protein
MARQSLIDYYRALIIKLEKDFRLSSNFFGREAIHELRVDIKQVRAFLALLSKINSDFTQEEAVSALDKLFKRAGKLRHFQLQLDLTKRYMDDLGLKLDWYYNSLKDLELTHRRKFGRFCDNFSFRPIERSVKSVTKAIKSVERNTVSTATLRHFEEFNERLRRVDLDASVEAPDLHLIRKLAKETRYALEVVRACVDSNSSYDLTNQQLRGLHQALGAWHDFDLAVLELQKSRSAEAAEPTGCDESLTRFSATLATERDLQLELFRARWIDFQAIPGRLPVDTSEALTRQE